MYKHSSYQELLSTQTVDNTLTWRRREIMDWTIMFMYIYQRMRVWVYKEYVQYEV